MDEVFITVLRHKPETAPELFLRMANALDGDQFALFLSGEAGWKIRFKVVMAMPKLIFIRALAFLLTGRYVQLKDVNLAKPSTTRVD
jgi:lycopene beta-cyclase